MRAFVDITEFRDPIEFLHAWLSHAQSKGSAFSLRALARRAGFSSPSLLSMVLSRKRRLFWEQAERFAKAMNLSHIDTQYFEFLVRSVNRPPDRTQGLLARERRHFSPVHYDVYRDNMKYIDRPPVSLMRWFAGKTYIIFGSPKVHGKTRIWRHRFFIDERSATLRCFRSHGHPSHFSESIVHYPKEVVFQPDSYLYIFWEPPVPQFHALPLTDRFKAGKTVILSDSGLICEAKLEL